MNRRCALGFFGRKDSAVIMRPSYAYHQIALIVAMRLRI